MNKLKRIGIAGVLSLALSLSVAGTGQAALTLGALTVASDGALTLTSTGATSDVVVTVGNDFTVNGVATSVYGVGTGNVAQTLNLGTGTDVDTINIGTGATGIDVIRIGQAAADLALTDANWSITTAGLITTAGDLAVNGDDITADGDLIVTGATGANMVATAGTLDLSAGAGNVTLTATGVASDVTVTTGNDFIVTGSATDSAITLGTGITTGVISIGAAKTSGDITLGKATKQLKLDTATGAVTIDAGGLTVTAGTVALPAGEIGTAELANAAITSAKLDEGTIKYAEVALSNAQILALTTAVEVVAAPGAGKVISFVDAIVIHDVGTADFATAHNVTINYKADGSGSAVSTTLANPFISGAVSDKISTLKQLTTDITTATKADWENQPLTIKASANPITGNGVGRVKVWYRIFSTGL